MTSLVVLMNNQAAAVAADTAVTISDGFGKTRTRTGVKKLFRLSEDKPVSIMIYGGAEIMGMSWGPIITQFRREFGGRSFDTVAQYADHFLSYLDSYDAIFSEDIQKRYYLFYLRTIYDWVIYTANKIAERERANPSPNGPRTPKQFVDLAAGYVLNDVTLYPDDEERAVLDGFDGGFAKRLAQAYGADIRQVVDESFDGIDVSAQARRTLEELAFEAVKRDFFPEFFPHTGLVFTGYGDKQLRPEMVSHDVGIAVLGRLRHKARAHRQVSEQDPVVVAPFAQDQMIHTFLTGMDEQLRHFLLDQTVELAIGIRDTTLASVPNLSNKQMREIRENKYGDEEIVALIRNFFGTLEDYQYAIHTHPILTAVEALPEGDLAETAESLVQLNAFQQKVSNDLETVGGDIDVAVMTMDHFKFVKSGGQS